MKSILRSIVAAGALSGLALTTGTAQMALPRNMSLAKESRLWLEGTSTMRSFKCTAGKLDVVVSSDADASPADLVTSASLVVPVAALDCGNGTMNEHMKKALKAGANPQISWKLSSYRVTGTTVVMNGWLMIAGKQNAIEITGTGSADAKGTIRMTGSKQFKMSEYGVKPPSLMLGTMKVRDPVTVSFDLILNQ
jgi:polyisoprenoid-binding protein YceI